MGDNENYIVIYEDRSEFHRNDAIMKYAEGIQSIQAKKRSETIIEELSKGYLEKLYSSLDNVKFDDLSDDNKQLLEKLTNGITNNNGRAIAGLTFLLLTIKSITPEQNIRLHKGNKTRGQFSWTDGVSMRTIDKAYTTKFLRDHNLIKLNADGIFMTRSLAENYPYTSLYKAKIQGPFKEFLELVDLIEDDDIQPYLGLQFFTWRLKKKYEEFLALANEAVETEKRFAKADFETISDLLTTFFDKTHAAARAYEVVMHGFMQAMQECKYLEDELSPLSQMRNANKKHGNVGDVELKNNGVITESWDAKYKKRYLQYELEELRDKILDSPGINAAGFVVDNNIERTEDIIARAQEIEDETGVTVKLFNFTEWVEYQTERVEGVSKQKLAYKWLCAVVESFAQKRRKIAPIDEPCEEWLKDIIKYMGEVNK